MREQKLTAAFRDQSAKENNAFETQEQQQAVAASERAAAGADDFAAAKERLQLRITRRKSRIGNAHNAVRENLSAKIGTEDDECRQQAQQGLIEAEQHRDAELARAAAELENFQQRLDETAGVFQQLEKSVRRAFGGYGKFRRRLNARNTPPEAELSGDGNELLDEFQRIVFRINTDLTRFKKSPLPQIFRFVPVWFVSLILLGVAVADPLLQHFGNHAITHQHAIIALATLAVVLVVYVIGLRLTDSLAGIIAGDFIRARRLFEASPENATTHHQHELERIEREFQEAKFAVNQEWKRATKEIARRRGSRPTELDDRFLQLNQRNEQFYQAELQRMQQAHGEKIQRGAVSTGNRKSRPPVRRNAQVPAGIAAKEFSDCPGGIGGRNGAKAGSIAALRNPSSGGRGGGKTFPRLAGGGLGRLVAAADFFANAVKFAQLEVDVAQFFDRLAGGQTPVSIVVAAGVFIAIIVDASAAGFVVV